MFGGHGGKRRTSGASGSSSQGSGFHGGFGGSGFHSSGFDSSGYQGGSFHGGFGSGGFDGFASTANTRAVAGILPPDLTVTFDEAAFGCDKMITLTGSDGRKQTLQLHIPAGMEDGKSFACRASGRRRNEWCSGGRPADLHSCCEKPDSPEKARMFYTTANIPFTTAVLGGEAIIQTLNGRVSCRIKPGTQSGSKIRLKGKGVANMRDPKTFGDLYVTVQIEVPTNLSAEALTKLKEFEAASNRAKRVSRRIIENRKFCTMRVTSQSAELFSFRPYMIAIMRSSVQNPSSQLLCFLFFFVAIMSSLREGHHRRESCGGRAEPQSQREPPVAMMVAGSPALLPYGPEFRQSCRHCRT